MLFRSDYLNDTKDTDEFSKKDELEQALDGSKFKNMKILDPDKYSDVIRFTNSKGEDDLILPMKKTEDFLYFKTNEKDEGKSRGKIYKISTSQKESNIFEERLSLYEYEYEFEEDDHDETCPMCDKIGRAHV